MSIRQFEELGSFAEAIAQFASATRNTYQIPNDNRRAEMELDLRIAVSGSLGDTTGFASRGNRAVRLSARWYYASARELTGRGPWWTLYSMFWIRQFAP